MAKLLDDDGYDDAGIIISTETGDPRWTVDGRRRSSPRCSTRRPALGLNLNAAFFRMALSLLLLISMTAPRGCRSLRTALPPTWRFSSSSWSCGRLGLDLPDLRGRGRGGRRRPSFAGLPPLATASSSTTSSQTSSSSSSNYYRIDPTSLFNQDIERVATSSSEDAAERADEMLAHMERLHDDGSRTVRPNALGFALVLEAYARRARRAHSRLLRLSSVSSSKGAEDDGGEGGKKRKEMKRAKSVLVTCADRVDDLHGRMKLRLPLLDNRGGEAVNGEYPSDEEIEALRRCHVAMLDVYHYSSRCAHESAPRAETLLDEMASLNPCCGDDGGNNTWPNVGCYRKVLEGYSDRRKDDSPVLASNLLRRMLGDDDAFPSQSEESSGTVAPPPPPSPSPSTPLPRPDVGCYGAVIRLWSRSRLENAAEEADKWLRRMIDDGCTPNVDIYGPVILALVRRTHDDGDDDADADDADEDEEGGGGSIRRSGGRRPKRGRSRSRVVDVGSIRRATELLHAAVRAYLSELDLDGDNPGSGGEPGEEGEGVTEDDGPGDEGISIASGDDGADASSSTAAATAAESLKLCFNAVIGAWGNSGGGSTEGAERAQSLLNKMEGLRRRILCGDVYGEEEEGDDKGEGSDDDACGDRGRGRSSSSPAVVLEPDVVSYNSVMNAWAKSVVVDHRPRGRRNGGVRSEEHHRLVANLAAAERCESILRRMIDGGEASARPDGISFATAIHAWARCCSSSGDGVGGGDDEEDGDGIPPAARAEALLLEMERLYRGARVELTAEQHLDEGERDQDRRRRLRQEYVESLRPNVMHHSAVIQAHAESLNPESAEALLRRMEEPGGDDDAVPQPDVVCYTTVIDAWARVSSGHGYVEGEASGRACAILERLEEANNRGLGLVPNVRTYTAVVRAISNDRCKGMARRARDVVDRMEVEATTTTPNIYTYNHLLNACANTLVDASVDERGEALSIAVDAFRTVMADSSSSSPSPPLRPDSFTYTFFLKACANLMPEGDRRDAVARRAFRRCCLDGRVNQEVLFRYRRALSTDAIMSFESRPSVEGDHVPVNDQRPRRTVRPSWWESVEDLPREWTRNARRR